VSDQIRLCRVCGIREVTVSVAIWQGDREQHRVFVCDICADREQKLSGYGGASGSLGRLAEFVAERQARRAGQDPDKGCPMCGATIAETVADGLLGCGYCYNRFKKEVAASIKLAQGSLQHLGKSPLGQE
jgi:protein arginine kinase activator